MKKIFYVVILILIIVLIGEISYAFVLDNQKEKKLNNINNVEEKIEIEKLLNMIPYSNKTCGYSDAYNGNKNTIESINKEILLFSAYLNVERYYFETEEEIFTLPNGNPSFCYVKKDDIDTYLYKAFRITNFISPTEISIPGGNLYFINNIYYIDFGAGAFPYEKLKNSYYYEIENDNLTIYEEVLFTILGGPTTLVYKNTADLHAMKNEILEISYTDEERENKANIDSKKQEALRRVAASKYKHIFRKDKDGYYWYSTEPIRSE